MLVGRNTGNSEKKTTVQWRKAVNNDKEGRRFAYIHDPKKWPVIRFRGVNVDVRVVGLREYRDAINTAADSYVLEKAKPLVESLKKIIDSEESMGDGHHACYSLDCGDMVKIARKALEEFKK